MKKLLVPALALCAVCAASLHVRADGEENAETLREVEAELEEDAVKRFSLHAYADVETAYVCRGFVWDSRPYAAQYIDGDIHLGDFGTASGYIWTMSALSGKGHSTPMRRAYNEVDYGLRYTYNWQIAEDWTLVNGVTRQWVTNPGVRHGGHSLIDWQAFQALENPFLTPYWRFRWIRKPYDANYWCVGLKRGFELTEDLVLTLDFFGDFGDSSHFRHLFGPKPGHEESNYHGGLQALNFVVRLDYSVTEYLGLYAFVGQFCLTSEDARQAIHASDAREAKRDLTWGGVGLKLDF